MNEDSINELERLNNILLKESLPKMSNPPYRVAVLVQELITALREELGAYTERYHAGWISMNDQQPEHHINVLIASKRGGIIKAYYTDSEWYPTEESNESGFDISEWTHWTYLPAPPQGEE